MSDYITLLGTEEVNRAASNMQSAADVLNRAVNNLDGVLDRNQRWMDDWLHRASLVFAEREDVWIKPAPFVPLEECRLFRDFEDPSFFSCSSSNVALEYQETPWTFISQNNEGVK